MGGAWPAGNIPGDRHDVYQKGHMLRLGKKNEKREFHFTFRSKFGLNGQHLGGSKIRAERLLRKMKHQPTFSTTNRDSFLNAKEDLLVSTVNWGLLKKF